jgi:hypothetical protein
MAAAVDADVQQSAIVRGIFSARALVLGADSAARKPIGIVAEMKSLGWTVLAEVPGREMVFGAVTQPWKANVVFRGVPPAQFASFREPDYVKIVWTLRADPLSATTSVFRTETRVSTTDASARAKFRWYWARFSPGIVLIRRIMLGVVRADAEDRANRVHSRAS